MPPLIQALQESTLPAELLDLLKETEQPNLFEQRPNLDLEDQLANLLRVYPNLPGTCQSAFWMLVGNLDLSHSVSQEIPSREGSYWHGIMHRRERDFWNAKYWFQKVGKHPVLSTIGELLLVQMPDALAVSLCVSKSQFDPARFTDLCGALVEADRQTADELREIAWLEWQLLFVHSLANG